MWHAYEEHQLVLCGRILRPCLGIVRRYRPHMQTYVVHNMHADTEEEWAAVCLRPVRLDDSLVGMGPNGTPLVCVDMGLYDAFGVTVDVDHAHGQVVLFETGRREWVHTSAMRPVVVTGYADAGLVALDPSIFLWG